MYCINCGVRLADTEKNCPLCGIAVYHPDLLRPKAEPTYPQDRMPPTPPRSRLAHVVVTAAFLLPLLLVLLADLLGNGTVTWSGYVIGALLVGYVIVVLPVWFRNPHPVIFTPCAFGAIALYLFYIDLVTPHQWFFTFALPIVGTLALIFTTVVTLMCYLSRGRLYIFGGALMAMGGVFLMTELLMNYTFSFSGFLGWSLYPLITLVLLGGTLILLAICGNARRFMERKFFI